MLRDQWGEWRTAQLHLLKTVRRWSPPSTLISPPPLNDIGFRGIHPQKQSHNTGCFCHFINLPLQLLRPVSSLQKLRVTWLATSPEAKTLTQPMTILFLFPHCPIQYKIWLRITEKGSCPHIPDFCSSTSQSPLLQGCSVGCKSVLSLTGRPQWQEK